MELHKFVNILSKKTNSLAEKLVFFLLSAITIIILMQIFFRYYRFIDVTWSEELSKILAVWLALIGASIGIKEGIHIGMNYFVDKFPSFTIKKTIKIVVNLIILLFLIITLIYGYIYTCDVAQQTAPGIKISMRWPYMAVPVGVLFISIQVFTLLFKDISSLIAGFRENNTR